MAVQHLHRETSEVFLTAPLIGRRAITPEREAPFLTDLSNDLLNQPFTLFVHSVDKWFCPLFLLSSGLPYQGFEMPCNSPLNGRERT